MLALSDFFDKQKLLLHNHKQMFEELTICWKSLCYIMDEEKHHCVEYTICKRNFKHLLNCHPKGIKKLNSNTCIQNNEKLCMSAPATWQDPFIHQQTPSGTYVILQKNFTLQTSSSIFRFLSEFSLFQIPYSYWIWAT